MPDPTLEERLIELETKLAFQDDVTTKLEATVSAQEHSLYKLKQEVEELRNQLKEASESGVIALKDEVPPPHY